MAIPPPVSRGKSAPIGVAVRPDRAEPALTPLQIRYYSRMHRQRVYAVTVSWHNKHQRRPPEGAPPVLLRLLMAGAQVVPAEQPLDPAKAAAKATFYVTPLARGWLRHEALEVLVDGRKVQELHLSARVTSQRTTWCLLALAILLPWFLLAYCSKYSKLTITPAEHVREDMKIRNQMAKNQKADKKHTLQPTPGQLLDWRIAENVPPLPDAVQETVPAAGEALVTARDFLGLVYDQLYIWTVEDYLPFYTCVTLLFLTVVSWFVHREKRRRRVGGPVPLPE